MTAWMIVQLWAAVASKYQIQPFFTLSIAPLFTWTLGFGTKSVQNYAPWAQIKSVMLSLCGVICDTDAFYRNQSWTEMLTCQTVKSTKADNNWFISFELHLSAEEKVNFVLMKLLHSSSLCYHIMCNRNTPWRWCYLWYLGRPWKFSVHGSVINLKEPQPMPCLLHCTLTIHMNFLI